MGTCLNGTRVNILKREPIMVRSLKVENKVAFWALLTVAASLFGMIYIVMPYVGDDYWYMLNLKDYFDGPRDYFPYRELRQTWVWHFQLDNIRASNVVFTFFLLIPKWIPSLLSGVMLFVSLVLSARLAGAEGYKGAGVIVILYTFALPWYDSIFLLCFAFNYVWSTALMLTLIYYYFFFNGKVPRRLSVVIMPLLGGALGIWHEGFALPVLTAVTVTMIVYPRRYFNLEGLLLIASMMAGLLFLFRAEGLQIQLEQVNQPTDMVHRLCQVMKWSPLSVLFMATAIVCWCKRSTGALMKEPLMVFLLAAVICSFAIHLKIGLYPRVSWAGQVCSIVGLTKICKVIYNQRLKKNKVLDTMLLIAIVLTQVYLIRVSIETFRVKDEINQANEAYLQSSTGEVFTSITTTFDASAFLLNRPFFEYFENPWYMKQIRKYYRRDVAFSPVNDQLRYYIERDGTPMPGTQNLREFNGLYVMPMRESEAARPTFRYVHDFECDIEYGGIYTEHGRAALYPFTSQADGRRYWLVRPLYAGFMHHFLPISRLHLTRHLNGW